MHQKLEKSLYKILFNDTSYSYSLLSKKFVYPSDFNTTAWTDYKQIGFNANFIEAESEGVAKFTIKHELAHYLLRHDVRGARMATFYNNFDWEVWNQACDYEINRMLQMEGEELPKTIKICLDPKFDGMMPEDIYHILKKEKDDNGGKSPRPAPMGTFKQPDKRETNGESDDDNENSDNGNNQKNSNDNGKNGNSITSGDLDNIEAKRKIEAQQAQAIANARGHGSAYMQQKLGDIPPSQDLREYIMQFLESLCRSDYSYRRPNRRYIQQGLYLPSLYGETFRTIVAASDTSGSITKKQTEKFVGMLKDCVAFYNEKNVMEPLRLIYCDDAVQEVVELTDGYEINPPVGGGTSFTPVFEYVAANNLDPAAVVYMTDGFGDCKGNVNYPVLWALTTAYSMGNGFKPPFGEKLYVGYELER